VLPQGQQVITQYRASELNLLIAAIIYWNSTYQSVEKPEPR
jgi:hypothetical protein